MSIPIELYPPAKVKLGLPQPGRKKIDETLQLPRGWEATRQLISPDGVTVNLQAIGKTAHYPACLTRSRSIHNRRRIQHLPCSGQARWLLFAVRHGYCRNPSCSRKIFAESLSPFARPQQHQRELIARGEAGRRATTASRIRIRADTPLRRVVQAPEQVQTRTQHVGIDEWA